MFTFLCCSSFPSDKSGCDHTARWPSSLFFLSFPPLLSSLSLFTVRSIFMLQKTSFYFTARRWWITCSDSSFLLHKSSLKVEWSNQIFSFQSLFMLFAITLRCETRTGAGKYKHSFQLKYALLLKDCGAQFPLLPFFSVCYTNDAFFLFDKCTSRKLRHQICPAAWIFHSLFPRFTRSQDL